MSMSLAQNSTVRASNKKRRFTRKRNKYKNRTHPGTDMEAYAIRNEILIEIGFRDYKAYLRSKLWKEIRARKIALNPACYGCDRSDDKVTIQVHHSKYTREVLLGETLDGLYTICARCHKWIEVTRGGYKRNPEDATIELFRLRKLYVMRRNNKPDFHRVQPRTHRGRLL